MKKIIGLLSILGMTMLLLSACGDENDPTMNGLASSSSKIEAKNSDSSENKKETSSESKESTSELSNDSIKNAISNKDSGIDIESVNGSYTNSDSTVQITLNGRELLSNKQTEKGMLMDISTIWKVMKDNFDYSKFSNIGVSIRYPLASDGGSSTDEFVIKSDVSGTKLDQLDSDDFLFKNVPAFATSWWQSEALPDL